jgi:hypothetical protein
MIQMNKNLLIVLGALAVVVVVLFLFTQNAQTPSQTVSPSANQAMKENVVTLTLGEQNESGESGTATLVEQEGKLVVTLNLTGAPAGVVQPAHIHTGTCANIGGVVYPLESPVNGVSETTLDTTLAELASQLPLAVNVHKSTTLASVYVSCGDLDL